MTEPLLHNIRDHYLPPDREAFRRAEPSTGRVIVIAPTRAACETIELALGLNLETVLSREHGEEIQTLARSGRGFGIMAGTGTGKTLAIRPMAETIVGGPLRVGVVNREREATPETPTWNVVIVTTGIARRWFQNELITPHDTLIVDEIHQTSAELELCLALGKRVGCRYIWLSATVDPAFYARYLESAHVIESSAFDPKLAARVQTRMQNPMQFLNERFVREVIKARRGVAVFVPTRAEVEEIAAGLRAEYPRLNAVFYHGGEPIRVIRPFLEGGAEKPFVLAMTAAGQSALNIAGLDTVIIYDARYGNIVERGRNVLTRQYLGPNEILQMAGRVHGRVANGQVFILTDRDLHFHALRPVPPEFQLAGDSERVALTAAAIGVDLEQLDLPVPLDRLAYREAVERLTSRGIVSNGRLTQYGKDVEALPVDRPWGELLVHADPELIPFVAIAANIDSLHRMTRDEYDLRGLLVRGSDHLTTAAIFAEAVEVCGYIGQVYGLPRHLFREEVAKWAEGRGVLVKTIEDVALGVASVYRTLEFPLPEQFPAVTEQVVRRFRDLVARIMPFELVIEGETARGESVRLSRSSVCLQGGAVAGAIRYFADKFGVSRGSIEGTSIPGNLIQQYATRDAAAVRYGDDRKYRGLMLERRTAYFGFELDRTREPLRSPWPAEYAQGARDTLVTALLEGRTTHPRQGDVVRVVRRVDEYWRRSGARLATAGPERVRDALREQLVGKDSWEGFLKASIALDLDAFANEAERDALDRLPTSFKLFGDRIPISYELDQGEAVARIRLRDGKARRLRVDDLPALDRPLRFAIVRGGQDVLRAGTIEELVDGLDRLSRGLKRTGSGQKGRPKKRGRRPRGA
ncbi:MAG: helicase-related protein [Gemmatimonadales bacterium]